MAALNLQPGMATGLGLASGTGSGGRQTLVGLLTGSWPCETGPRLFRTPLTQTLSPACRLLCPDKEMQHVYLLLAATANLNCPLHMKHKLRTDEITNLKL